MKAILLLATLVATPAFAQTADDLKRENEALRARLAQIEGQQTQLLTYAIKSVRAQPARSGPSHLVVTVEVRNRSTQPLALNYLGRSIKLVDNNGLAYSPTQNYGKIHGIPVASETRADATPNLPAGGTLTFVFDATSYLKNGERMGSAFDLFFTLGQFGHNAQGQIVKVQDHPVSFTNVPIEAGTPQVANDLLDQGLDRLLRRK